MHRAYCADIPFLKATEQKAALEKLGVECGDIRLEGRGAENFNSLLDAFNMRRDKIKQLSIWGTLRVFGDSRKAIMSRIKELHAAGIVVTDRQAELRSDRDGAEMLDQALRRVQGSNALKGSREWARKQAKKGGKGKLDSMRSKRMPEEVARPIWQCEKLTADERLKLLNPPGYFEGKWTAASAYRHLGKKQ